jgi:hypothetical protein
MSRPNTAPADCVQTAQVVVAIVGCPPGTPLFDRHPHRAIAEGLAFGGEREHVRGEEHRCIDFVAVVDLDCAVHPGDSRASGGLGLADDERHTVDPQHEVVADLDVGLGLIDDLRADQVIVLAEVFDVDQAHGDVLPIRAEGHTVFAHQPGGEALVGAHQPLRANAEQDGPQLVKYLVGARCVFRDGRVEPDERVTQVLFEEHLVVAARQVFAVDLKPAHLRAGQ